MRGAYRVEEDALERYELFIGQDADPDPDGTPDETFTSLPHETAALTPGHTYRFLLRRRNKHGLSSQNLSCRTVIVAGDGSETEASPSGPDETRVEAAAAGTIRVRAWYHPGPDGDAAADTFLVFLATGGGDPDPDNDSPITTATMDASDGTARLDWTSGAYADGTTVKVIVRSRRSGTPNYDSENTTIFTVGAETSGPSTPDSAGLNLGAVAEVS